VKHRGGEWKLVSTGIAQRKELEKWCSNSCAKMAYYVKVQLNETAAWERAGIPSIKIDLLGDEKITGSSTTQIERELEGLKLEDKRKAADQFSALALERGDTTPKTGQIGTRGLMKVTIREKEARPPKEGISFMEEFEDEDDDHLQLEGHRPKFGADKATAPDVDVAKDS
jgi:RNA polymerase II-associated protein 2